MRQSDEIKDLAAAIVKAQAEIKPALKDATNPHLKSKYADLASVWAAARETLGKHGLCVIQSPGKLEGNTLELTTRLLHQSGQWLEDTISLPVVKLDAQTCGGAITYARRYSLSAMLGIVADDDDDGHSGTHGQREERPRQNPGQQRTQQAVERQERPYSAVSQPRPAPESRGDQAASGTPPAGGNTDLLISWVRDLWKKANRPNDAEAVWTFCSECALRQITNWRQLTADELRAIGKALEKEVQAKDRLPLDETEPNPLPGHAR